MPSKRRYTGALIDRQSLSATPWKVKVLQMELMTVEDISVLSDFQVILNFSRVIDNYFGHDLLVIDVVFGS